MNVYKIVQQKIIERLEEAIENGGVAPWRKPWNSPAPKNYITKKEYRGINYILLEGGSYLTFKQIKDLQKKNKEIKLKKGSKSSLVVYWNFIKKEDEEGNEKEFPLLKYYNVFSIKDVEGLEEENVERHNHEPIETAEELVNYYRSEVPIYDKTVSDRAFYSIVKDTITMPKLSQFKDREEFYATLFHEMIHSTGNKKRFKRFEAGSDMAFGSESYSKEELVAEIGSNMLMSKLQIDSPDNGENSTAYLLGWLNQIREDLTLITFASQQAQKACDYILSFHPELSENLENSEHKEAI